MRLRLQIKRHELPTRNLLWHVQDDTVSVSKLVEQINEIIPLESDQDGWGLEDYIVEVEGFECLHFGIVKDTFSNDDVVWVRPLEHTEIRQRRRSGSYQIAASGAHLIDGIAFGKTYIKRPARPDINIPPRKKRRIESSNEGEQEGEVESSKELENVSKIENGDVTRGIGVQSVGRATRSGIKSRGVGGSEGQGVPSSVDMMLDADDTQDAPHKKRKRVSFSEAVAVCTDSTKDVHTAAINGEEDEDEDEEEEEEEEDDDFEPGHSDSDHSDSSDDDSEGDASDSGSDKDNLAEVKNLSSPNKFRVRQSALHDAVSGSVSESESSSVLTESSSEVSADSSSESDSSSEESDTSSDQASESGSVITRDLQQQQRPPGEGLHKTKSRNERRRLGLQLARLKKQGRAPPNADLAFLRAHPQGIASKNVEESVEDPSSTPPTLPEPNASSMDVDMNDVDATQVKSAQTHASGGEGATEPQSKRRRLDVSSSRRLIFGGLGLRTPKTKADEDLLRTKLITEAEKRKAGGTTGQNHWVAPGIHQTAQNVETNDQDTTLEEIPDDSWKSKLTLLAVECHDQGVRLSTPPFPFEQRWDPQQRHQYRRDNFAEDGSLLTAKQKRRRKARQRQKAQDLEIEDEGWYESEMFEGEGLDYDDTAVSTEDSDLPTLPEDMSSLSDLTVGSLENGMTIAFKQLEVSEKTKWQPEISKFKTAVIINVDNGSTIAMRLAQRDRDYKERQYDDEGNRIFAKFEMPIDEEDEDEDDGYRQLSFEELIEPKNVQEAAQEYNVVNNSTILDQDLTNALVPDSPILDAVSKLEPDALAHGDTDIVQNSIAPVSATDENMGIGEGSSEFTSLSSELSGSNSPISAQTTLADVKHTATNQLDGDNPLNLVHAGIYDSSSNELQAAQAPRDTLSNSTLESIRERTSQNSDNNLSSKRVLRSASRASQESINYDGGDSAVSNGLDRKDT